LLLLALPARAAITFVNQGSNNLSTSATSMTVTIPATVAGNDLVAVVSIGIDIAPNTTVSSVTATGATFASRVVLSNGVARVEIWSARGISAGITTVTINFVAATNATAAVAEYSGVAALGTTATNSGATANPTVSLTTQDANNFVVGGFSASAAGIAAFTALTGTLRAAPVTAAGDVTDVAGALTDNTSATPASVTNAVTQAANTWAAAALELRSTSTCSGICYKQSTFVAEGSSTPVASITSPAMTVAAGDLLIVFCRSGPSTQTGVTVTSSPANTFNQLTAQVNTWGVEQESYALSAGAGSTTFTCTPAPA